MLLLMKKQMKKGFSSLSGVFYRGVVPHVYVRDLLAESRAGAMLLLMKRQKKKGFFSSFWKTICRFSRRRNVRTT